MTRYERWKEACERLRPQEEWNFRIHLNHFGLDLEMEEDKGIPFFWEIQQRGKIPIGAWYGNEVWFGNGEKYKATDIHEVIDALKQLYKNMGMELRPVFTKEEN